MMMSLALSRYGIFVLQKYLECSPIEGRNVLLARIKNLIPLINKESIKLRLIQRLNEFESLFM